MTNALMHPIRGGVIPEIIYGLKKNGGLIRDTSADTRIGKGLGGTFFDIESHKFLFDPMILEVEVTPYITFSVPQRKMEELNRQSSCHCNWLSWPTLSSFPKD